MSQETSQKLSGALTVKVQTPTLEQIQKLFNF